MTRNLLLATVALALWMASPNYRCQVVAQQSDPSAAAPANQSNDQQSADAKNTTHAQQQRQQSSASSQSDRQRSSSAATQSNSQQQQPQQQQQSQQRQPQPQQGSSSPANANNNQRPNAQPSNNGAATPPNTQPAPGSNSNNNLPAARNAGGAQGTSAPGTTSNEQAFQGARQSMPAPRTDTRGTQPQERSMLNQDQQATKRGAAPTDGTRAGANASVQGRANFDARSQQRQQFDLRSGVQFGRATDRGLMINAVDDTSVFFRSGLRRGDVLVSVYGRPIRSEAEFAQWISQYPGERIPIVVLRDGVQQTIFVDYPGEPAQQQVYVNRPVGGPAYLGVFFDTQIPDAAVLRSVTPGTPAEQAGLQQGDMIVALNGAQVTSYPEAISIIRSMQPGERLDMVVQRGRSQQQTQAVLAGQPSEPFRTATRDVNIYSNPQVIPPPVPREQRIYNERGYYDRPYRDRPLRQRLFD